MDRRARCYTLSHYLQILLPLLGYDKMIDDFWTLFGKFKPIFITMVSTLRTVSLGMTSHSNKDPNKQKVNQADNLCSNSRITWPNQE